MTIIREISSSDLIYFSFMQFPLVHILSSVYIFFNVPVRPPVWIRSATVLTGCSLMGYGCDDSKIE